MVSKMWDEPADQGPGADNHVELTGPDQNGNEWPVGLYGRSAGHEPEQPMVGDVGINRRTQ
jgi:hypothetical protein